MNLVWERDEGIAFSPCMKTGAISDGLCPAEDHLDTMKQPVNSRKAEVLC